MDIVAKQPIQSVSELNQAIKSMLEVQFRFVHLRGEISNLRTPYSGHIYFTLKDENSQIRAVLFKGQQKYLQTKLSEGQSVVCHGRLSVYEPRGEYQIIIDTVESSGTGELQRQFERLKMKLRNEGLFLSERKRSLPQYPEKVAIITSPTGAAVQDFLKIARKRRYWGEIVILPVVVQGNNASREIAEALDWATAQSIAEVIVLIRGGGSLEDLWAFNEETTARAISRSSIPVITGIGHETDFTIADMCADVHTHTPTAAAEALLPDAQYLEQSISDHKKFLEVQLADFLEQKQQKVEQLLRVIGNLNLFFQNQSLQLDYQLFGLQNAMEKRIISSVEELTKVLERFKRKAPSELVNIKSQHLLHLKKTLHSAINLAIERRSEKFGRITALLEASSPLAILARGYSVVSKCDESPVSRDIITREDQVRVGDKVDIQLHLGRLHCQVLQKKGNE